MYYKRNKNAEQISSTANNGPYSAQVVARSFALLQVPACMNNCD
jgi:hypothetical protein